MFLIKNHLPEFGSDMILEAPLMMWDVAAT